MVLYKEFVENDRDYASYEDLKKNFKIRIPENFNFAYDVVDRYAKDDPEKRALARAQAKHGWKRMANGKRHCHAGCVWR